MVWLSETDSTYSFRYNTRTWQTDRRQTDGHRTMA